MNSRRSFLWAWTSVVCIPLFAYAAEEEPLVTLSFSAISLRQLLQMLAQMKNLNLVMSEKVAGKISIYMRDAPWSEVLETLLASRSLSYKRDGLMLWIAPEEELIAYEKRKLARSGLTQQLIPPKQIMIEARIVEAERRFAQNLGAKLALGFKDSPFKMESTLVAAGLHGYEPASAAISLLGREATKALNLELSALESNGLGNVVSNPRVLATENTLALIEQGTELPYQSSTGKGATKVQFRKANLRLEVKPQIQKNHMISLEVDINKDSVGLKTEQGFAIDTKHVKTQVMVESGGTVVLGGIFQEADRNDSAKVPFLSEIPLIGALFKQEAKIKDKTELLIFLTPTLVSGQKPQ